MGVEVSPKKKARQRAARKRQEKRWKEKCGPVIVRIVDPATLKKGDTSK